MTNLTSKEDFLNLFEKAYSLYEQGSALSVEQHYS